MTVITKSWQLDKIIHFLRDCLHIFAQRKPETSSAESGDSAALPQECVEPHIKGGRVSEQKSDSILFIASFHSHSFAGHTEKHTQEFGSHSWKDFQKKKKKSFIAGRKHLEVNLPKNLCGLQSHMLLQPEAAQRTQPLVNHQIGYSKLGLFLIRGQPGLFDLEKFKKERVVSLVGGCGKLSKKKTKKKQMTSEEIDGGIVQRPEGGCEGKYCFWIRWNSIHHLVKNVLKEELSFPSLFCTAVLSFTFDDCAKTVHKSKMHARLLVLYWNVSIQRHCEITF